MVLLRLVALLALVVSGEELVGGGTPVLTSPLHSGVLALLRSSAMEGQGWEGSQAKATICTPDPHCYLGCFLNQILTPSL